MIQFDIKNQSFRQVMGNGLKYKVPRFQRDYSWKDEQWEDLWQDTIEAFQIENNFHYMGYLVLQSSDNKNFTIIDDQQRLTTISIFILAALYELKNLANNHPESDENKKRLDALRNSFIGFMDPVSLLMEHKLTLNRNNDSHFKSYLCDLSEPPVRNINRSERLMGKALQYFRERIINYIDEKIEHENLNPSKKRTTETFNTKGEEIARLIEATVDTLIFTAITVGNDTNAYTIFETLNARGIQLSTPDLVKNYIFSLIDKKSDLHDEKIKVLEDKWSRVIGQLGAQKFSNFIRVDWNSRNNFSRASGLFKKIKTDLINAESAKRYLEYLKENSQIYSAINNEDDEFWRQHKNGQYNTEELRLRLKTLNLFHITAPQSALIAGFHKFNPKDFIQFLYYIEVLSIRYNIICGKNPSSQERVYCEVARAIAQSTESDPDLTLEILKKTYPSDEEFTRAFEIKSFKIQQTTKRARYFLYRIERYLSGGETVNFNEVTLEHILPQNPSEKWGKKFKNEDRLEEWINRAGNITLLPENENKDISGKEFEEKKQFFKNSSFQITQKCAEYEQWNENSIFDRQKWLAEQAQALWRLP